MTPEDRAEVERIAHVRLLIAILVAFFFSIINAVRIAQEKTRITALEAQVRELKGEVKP